MNHRAGKEEEIFEAARHIVDPAQRRAYLEKACADDATLYQQLEALLSAYAEADSFLSQSISSNEKSSRAN